MRKIPITDHRLFEVRLIVAVPDYGTGTFDALDAIVPFIDEEVTVLDMSSKAVVIALDEPNHPATATFTITNNTTTTTVPVVKAETPAKTPAKKQRTRVKAKKSGKRWTTADHRKVFELREQGMALADIAAAVGRSRKSVADHIHTTKKETQHGTD